MTRAQKAVIAVALVLAAPVILAAMFGALLKAVF